MNRTTKEMIGQFEAVDERGTVVRILVIQNFTEVRTLNNGIQRIAGTKEYRTERGDPVTAQADGTLFDLRGHRVLRRLT